MSRIGVARQPPIGVVAVEVPDRFLFVPLCDRRLLHAAHRRGLKVFVWTVDDERRMAKLLRLGVDGIMTNRPSVLARLIARG